ncbi:MAG: ribosome biogenesis GTPase Der [Alphaproteobacteria bacterium]|nr:ribosome biogenesis GTPase Der [Alphaproteobacteria bacterium]
MKDIFKVALVGRPNVGKSTLFNRLAGKKIALVDDRPGMTRDRREQKVMLAGLPYIMMDMAGFEEVDDKLSVSAQLQQKMNQQIKRGFAEADLILFMLDGRAGLLPDDEIVAKKVIMSGSDAVALVNKIEKPDSAPLLADFARLGFENYFAISASHGLGIDALKALLIEKLEDYYGDDFTVSDDDKKINLVLMGRPNVGKSTLINRLLDDDRVLVHDLAGTTRDALCFDWAWQGNIFSLYDTAGLRRKRGISEIVEQLSSKDSLKAIRFSHIVAIVVDATEALERQELRLIRHAADEGRAVMILLNKWDKVRNKSAALQKVEQIVADTLPMIRYVPIITLSALKDDEFDIIPQAALQLYDLWCKKISTSKLNEWLAEKVITHSPPLVSGRRLKIRYITQIKARPPQFHLFASADIPEHYLRYLAGALRDDFAWHGVPLRLIPRRGKNPYADKKPKRKLTSRKMMNRKKQIK